MASFLSFDLSSLTPSLATSLVVLLILLLLAFKPPSLLLDPIPTPSSHQIKDCTALPHWIDSYAAPRVTIHASCSGIPIVLGQKMDLNLTQERLCVRLVAPAPYDRSLLTLLLVDPDHLSPNAPTVRNFMHWMVTNIPGSAAGDTEPWEVGNEVMHYMGPAPPKGLHRYYLLIFKQPGRIDVRPLLSRMNFSVRDFTEQYGLGYPVGGMYFTVQAGH